LRTGKFQQGARPALQADVARLAGVSPQTVSRSDQPSGYVGADARERVLAPMRTLNHRPNSVLPALENSAHARGYAVSVTTLEAVDREEFLAALKRLERQGVEGILSTTGRFPA
jgi:DNA-binding LacI/PurR family transcriptional regulator